MISLLKFLDGPWEKVRGYLKNDLDTIQVAMNQRWSATFGNNNVLPPSAGGIGSLTPFVVGDILTANSTTSLSKIADVATGNALISGGVGVIPKYGKIGLTTHVTGLLPVGSGGTGTDLSAGGAVGDLLSAASATTFTRIPMVSGGSILVSTSGPAAARWATNVTLGTAGTGVFSVLGKISATYTQLDATEFTLNINSTLPTVTTSTRTGINFDVTTAGSSAHDQQGGVFTLEAGYTGASRCFGLKAETNVASTGFVVGLQGHAFGAAAVNIGVNAFCNAGTQNIAVFAGLGNTDGSTFSSGISACVIMANGTTGKDLIQGYSNVTKNFSVTDAGLLTAASTIVAGNNLQCGASSFVTWNGKTAIESPADGTLNIEKQSTVVGVGLDVTTDGLLKVRTRAQNAYAPVDALGFRAAGAATTGHVLRGDGTNFVDAALASTDVSDITTGSWTPIDSSGAGLTFVAGTTGTYFQIGKLIFVSCLVKYPATADATAAKIGGLPFTCNATQTALAVGSEQLGTAAVHAVVNASATTISPIVNGAVPTNAAMTLQQISMAGCYIST